MKFQGNRQRLLEALNVVNTVIAARSIKPILQNVRLVVDPTGATLLGTDLEIAIRYRVELSEVAESGDILLPAARLFNILRECTADDVKFDTTEQTMRLRCGGGTFRILGSDPGEFPVVPSLTESQALIIEREPFRTLIRKTVFATAKEKSRYAFNGVRFEVEGDEARMVATDGKRMAVKSVVISNPDGLKAAHIIPTKGLLTIERVLSEEDNSVRISLDDKQIMVRTGRAEISARLVEGAFPRYQSVIPKEVTATATFAREALLTAMRQASILTNEESKAVRMSLEDGRFILTSRATDVGDSRLEIEAVIEGDTIQSAFNPEYLIEGLKAIDADTVHLRVSGKDTPGRLDGEANYIYVIMPVTLRTG